MRLGACPDWNGVDAQRCIRSLLALRFPREYRRIAVHLQHSTVSATPDHSLRAMTRQAMLLSTQAA